MDRATVLFIGTRGTVMALDRSTGQEVWRSELKGRDFVNLVIDDGVLYATTKGEVFCLDPTTGQIRWQNELRGFGRGLVTIASADGSGLSVVREKHRREEAAAAATTAGAAGAR